MRYFAAALALFAFSGCAEDEMGLPEDPRNAAECRHKASYGGEATSLDNDVQVTARVQVNDSDIDNSVDNDMTTYRTWFTIRITTIANSGAMELAAGEALEIPVFCDGEFAAIITDQAEPFEMIGTVDGVITSDSASGDWAITNDMGTWTGIWGGPPIELECSESAPCPEGFLCNDDGVCL